MSIGAAMAFRPSFARLFQGSSSHFLDSSRAQPDLVTSWLSRITSLRSTQADAIELGRVNQLYLTLPTRGSSKFAFSEPSLGQPLHRGHHLALFPPLDPESTLNPDGTNSTWTPPLPFKRRMWAGGRFVFNPANELKIGEDVSCEISVGKVDVKGIDSLAPKLFVHQKRQISNSRGLALEETRTHVFLPPALEEHRPSSLVRSPEGRSYFFLSSNLHFIIRSG